MKKLLLVLLCSLPLTAMEESALKIKAASLQVPGRLGKVSVLHDEEGFRVKQDGNLYEVNNGDVDKEIRHISNASLKSLLTKSYIAVNQSDNGEFSLKAHTRVKGCGPILAGFLYGATKALCYGTLLAGAAAGIGLTVATGGTAGAVAGGAVGLAGDIVGITGAGVVAGAISGTATGTAIATTATGVAASTGCVATVVGSIEGLASLAFLVGAALPTI